MTWVSSRHENPTRWMSEERICCLQASCWCSFLAQYCLLLFQLLLPDVPLQETPRTEEERRNEVASILCETRQYRLYSFFYTCIPVASVPLCTVATKSPSSFSSSKKSNNVVFNMCLVFWEALSSSCLSIFNSDVDRGNPTTAAKHWRMNRSQPGAHTQLDPSVISAIKYRL